MVPLHFLTPRYDLPVIPVNINCQGPPLTPLQPCVRVRPGAAARVRCASPSASRSSARAASRTGRRRRTPARSTKPGIASFSTRFIANDREALTSYSDEETLRDAGQGGFEIRTFLTVAGATEGATGELLFYAPMPIFAVGCTVATMAVE